ncbi:9076_t:CDS:2, partial [Acaulospora colombiana]
ESVPGFTFVLPEDDRSIPNQIIIIPMLHKPIVDRKYDNGNQTTSMRIDFVDPWDMSSPIGKIDYDVFLLSRDSNDFADKLRQGIEPSEFMRILGYWRSLDNEITDLICAELDSSVKQQEHTYNLPCPTPSLHSSSIEWEQSLVEGHSLHP